LEETAKRPLAIRLRGDLNITRVRPFLIPMKLSVGTQLAAVTVAVLTLVTTLLVVGLASQEHDSAISKKSAAATMVTELFAASAAAGVVFADEDAVQAVLTNLRKTEDVIGGSVFSVRAAAPIGTFGKLVTPTVRPGVRLYEDELVVTREITDNENRVVGRATVVFSLLPENAAQLQTRRNLALGGLVVMLITAALLIVATRSRIVKPLERLASAATELERGELTNRASEYGNSEVADLARAFNRMGDAVQERERLLKLELKVAADLQLSILPRDVEIAGLETAAMMKPATEVGGDYYDIIPTADGCWIGIGDVSGHGLGAGVIMLMIQSAIAALVSANPHVSPVEVECVVNRVLYENIRERMGRRDHATLSILRYTHDGRIRFAGAHEEIIVYRAATSSIETFDTPGTWVGARKEVAGATVESELRLEPDDVLVLYTDGVTEAMRNRKQLGFDRLVETVREAAGGSAYEVRDAIVAMVAEWTAHPADDVSVVVIKQANVVRAKEAFRAAVMQEVGTL
jgi:serine phosphatase RsbU (regulator of sigma subunit)